MESDRFRRRFPAGHVVLPVIHVAARDQALRNAETARRCGAQGVFLINHAVGAAELLDVHAAVVAAQPDWWVGVNCLDLSPRETVERVSARVDGIWVDNALIDERSADQPAAASVTEAIAESGWPGLYFGGVAFKYQRPVEDLAVAVRSSIGYVDVVTTSGPGTGQAATVEKIRTMKEALGEAPLAIASGITPENVCDYLPCSDCYLVATGVSESFEELDEMRLRALVDAVLAWDRRQG